VHATDALVDDYTNNIADYLGNTGGLASCSIGRGTDRIE